MTKKESADAASMHPIVHTPGPWMVLDFRSHPDGEWIAIASNTNPEKPEVVTRIRNEVSGNPLNDVDCANAKLIAASPMMLEALRRIVRHQDLIGGSMASISSTRHIAAQAIQHATGEVV